LEEYIVFWKLLAPPHTHPPAFWTAHTSLCKTCIEEQMLQAILEKKDAYFRWILFVIQLDYSRGHLVDLSFCLKPGSNRNTQP
jgi:hypothetical protein